MGKRLLKSTQIVFCISIIYFTSTAVVAIGNCEYDWKHMMEQRECIIYHSSEMELKTAAQFCTNLEAKLYDVKHTDQLEKVMKFYHGTALSVISLPYILLPNQSVVSIGHIVVKDCEICNRLMRGINWQLINSSQLCIVVKNSNRGMAVKAAQCSPTGFLCSKPDISLSKTMMFTRYDLAAVLVLCFLLVSLGVIMYIDLKREAKKIEDEERKEIIVRTHRILHSGNNLATINEERKNIKTALQTFTKEKPKRKKR